MSNVGCNQGRNDPRSAEASRAALLNFGARYAEEIAAAVVLILWLAAGAV